MSPVINQGGRARIVSYTPELLQEDYAPPRTNLARILQQLAANDEQLLRRES